MLVFGCEITVLIYLHILFLPAVLAEFKRSTISGKDVVALVIAVSKGNIFVSADVYFAEFC